MLVREHQDQVVRQGIANCFEDLWIRVSAQADIMHNGAEGRGQRLDIDGQFHFQANFGWS